MKRLIKVVLVVASLVALTACGRLETKNGVYGLGGAALGGLIGSQIGSGNGQLAATAIGVLLGYTVGSDIGRKLNREDIRRMSENTRNSLEYNATGKTSRWNNPDTRNFGTFRPTRTYRARNSYCREYQVTISVGGETKRGYGTACRQTDGSWKVAQ